MESRYGVGINNRYALFLDQDDVEDEAMLKKAAETAAATTKKAKETAQKVNGVAPVAPKKDTTKPTAPTQTSAPNKKPEAGKPPKGEDKENRGNRFEGKRVLDARKPQEGPREPRNREDRNNRRNKPDDENASAPAPASGFGQDAQPRGDGEGRRGGRGGGRGGRGGERGERGERRGGGGDRGFGGGERRGPRPRRDFDRKSGDDKTGVKPVDKREGGGSHNWGTYEDEIKAEEDKANTSTDEVTAETTEAPPTDEEVKPESDEPKVMTLDEYKKQMGERSGPKFNLRKAGEGSEIDPKWKKTYAYKKEKETHDEDEDEEHELYPQRVNRQKRLMDIEINFVDPNRGGGSGGRGGRGGGRGGRGERRERPPRPEGDAPPAEKRGEKRGGRSGPGPKPFRGRGGPTEAPNVNDEQSFPSLG